MVCCWTIGTHFAGCSKSLSSKAAASEEARRTLRYVEPLSDARTMHGNRRVSARRGWAGEKNDFFSILLEAKDIEDSDAHKDAVVGKRSECMSLHKREKGRDHNPGDDERHEHPDPECQIVVLPEDIP